MSSNDTRSSGRTILPLEASGEYTLGSGGMVDVELQPDRLERLHHPAG